MFTCVKSELYWNVSFKFTPTLYLFSLQITRERELMIKTSFNNGTKMPLTILGTVYIVIWCLIPSSGLDTQPLWLIQTVRLYVLTILLLQGVQNQSKCWYTSPGISSALKKSKHCQTLRVVSTFAGQNESTGFWLVKALSGIVEGGQNDSKNLVKNAPGGTFGSTVKTGSWLVLTTRATFS